MRGVTDLDLGLLIDERLAAPAAIDSVALSYARPGPLTGRRQGDGLEQEDLRVYAAGDDPRRIDWRVSARRKSLHVRSYREEREQALTLLVDLGSGMFTGSRTLAAVDATRLAARDAWRAVAAGRRVGVALRLPDAIDLRAPGRGLDAALAVCRRLANGFAQARDRQFRTNDENPASLADEANSPTLQALLDHVGAAGRATGHCRLFSRIDTWSDALDATVRRLALARRLEVVRLVDPLEQSGLPPGVWPLRHAGGTRHVRLDAEQARALRILLETRRRELSERLSACGVPWRDAASLPPPRPPAAPAA